MDYKYKKGAATIILIPSMKERTTIIFLSKITSGAVPLIAELGKKNGGWRS